MELGMAMGWVQNGAPLSYSHPIYIILPHPCSKLKMRHVDEYPSQVTKNNKKKIKINLSSHRLNLNAYFVWMGRIIFSKPTILHQSTKSPMNKFTIFIPLIYFFEKTKKIPQKFWQTIMALERKGWKKKIECAQRWEVSTFKSKTSIPIGKRKWKDMRFETNPHLE